MYWAGAFSRCTLAVPQNKANHLAAVRTENSPKLMQINK